MPNSRDRSYPCCGISGEPIPTQQRHRSCFDIRLLTCIIIPVDVCADRRGRAVRTRHDIDVAPVEVRARRIGRARQRDGLCARLLVHPAREVRPRDIIEGETSGGIFGTGRDVPAGPVAALLNEDWRGCDILEVEVLEVYCTLECSSPAQKRSVRWGHLRTFLTDPVPFPPP